MHSVSAINSDLLFGVKIVPLASKIDLGIAENSYFPIASSSLVTSGDFVE